ncbi:phosphopantetheine-binding protein [Nocardia sp. NPDC050793]|uniref:phosphopantetheine-binding protein n=1 Tax=Nocardia sp. NPDC050793 TaxID=3155159 RepID=UPI0033F2180C
MSDSITQQAADIPGTLLEWSRILLNDATVGPDDNFIDAGGHSLLAQKLSDSIREKYGVDLSFAVLFNESIERVAEDLVAKVSA